MLNEKSQNYMSYNGFLGNLELVHAGINPFQATVENTSSRFNFIQNSSSEISLKWSKYFIGAG